MSVQALRRAVVAACVAVALCAPAASAQGDPAPYGLNDAGGFYNVLPAGEAGVDNLTQLAQFETAGTIPPHFNDQLPLYQNLVYADPTLTPAKIPGYFKDATFGVKQNDVQSVETDPGGETGLTIVRD